MTLICIFSYTLMLLQQTGCGNTENEIMLDSFGVSGYVFS